MNYHNITHDDMLNGEGLRTVLWVAGCDHHCPGCQNPETWDPEGGIEFDDDAVNELFAYLDKDYCAGLTLTGGDPLYSKNLDTILGILVKFRARYDWNKTIWVYTGYELDDLYRSNVPEVHAILDLIDVIVTGPYMESQKCTERLWVGSDNQEIWRQYDGPDIYGWKRDAKQYQDSLNEKGVCHLG